MVSTVLKKVAIITTSTRAVRVGPHVSSFVQKTLISIPTPGIEISILDLATFKLPVYDEAVVPAYVPAKASFRHEHSKAWSAAIAAFDAYIIVSPEYNAGIPGGTKNAIDYLYNDWIGKPVLIVTYGLTGGQACSKSLKEILTAMKLRVMETRPQIAFADMGDVGIAINSGELAEKSAQLWEKKEREPLLKGFGELVEALNTPVKETVEEPVKE